MIDLHAHLLPGIDDGPASWDDALEIVRLAEENGVTAMAATSHMLEDRPWDNRRDDVLPLVEELKRRVEQAGLAMHIVAGGEVQLTYDVAQRIAKGQVLTYGDARRYVLLEMPWAGIPPFVPHVLFELKTMGITPIIAHPERYDAVKRRPDIAREWVEHGALLQVNVGSLLAGEGSKAAAHALLASGLVHFLASDGHNVRRRPPLRSRDYERVAQALGEEAADVLLRKNPAAVLAGEPIDAEAAPRIVLPEEKRGERFMRRLWRGKK